MRNFIYRVGMITLVLLLFTFMVFADQPPDPGGGGPTGGEPVGGGSPLGGSFLIMLILSIGYSVRKFFEIRRNA